MLKESEPAPRRKIINTKKPYTSASLQPDLQREAKWNHTKRPTEIVAQGGNQHRLGKDVDALTKCETGALCMNESF